MSAGDSNRSYDRIRSKYSCDWPMLQRAASESSRVLGELSAQFADRRIQSADWDVVVFGSLARGEWTSGSDVDWTLLVDGQADSEHRHTAHEVQRVIEHLKLPRPSLGGSFGSLSFSHEIIHHIGGHHDTNRNTSQRILLLLESRAVCSSELTPVALNAHERVVRAILERYLKDDTGFYSIEGSQFRVPRFLLNDIVRFWRTMCVDFAWKEWEEKGEKWALRNIKLRMSRKLLFITGLLLCFSCYEEPAAKLSGEPSINEPAENRLLPLLVEQVKHSPLELLCSQLELLGFDRDAVNLLDLYDRFLGELDDGEVRKHLNHLKPEKAYSDPVFLRIRKLSNEFQDIITEVFLRRDSPLRNFTYRYGVF